MGINRVHESIYRIDAPYEGLGIAFPYLVEGERVALVDTGAAGATPFLEAGLAEIGMKLSDVDLLLNTHAHVDHGGANAEVKAANAAAIYLHSGDLPFAQDVEAEVRWHTGPMRAMGFPEQMVEQRAAFVRRLAGAKVGADVVLSGGDTVDLGAGTVFRSSIPRPHGGLHLLLLGVGGSPVHG